jgi:hypothetical protein
MTAATTPHSRSFEALIAPETASEGQAQMTPQDRWGRSEVHRHSAYSCAKCGKRLRSPAAVYRHLETRPLRRAGG